MGENEPGAPVTVLFTDVEGSTDLRTRRGDSAAHEVLRRHEVLVRERAGEHGGREVKALGDGFMLAFASARRALECAAAIQLAVDERGTVPGGGVRIRIGVNTGEVVEENGDLFGQAVNAAARIAGRAQGGEILVSDVTRQLVGSGPQFRFRDRGRVRLKGFPDRWRLHELSWAPEEGPGHPPVARRTPFVGREAERRELHRLLESAAGCEGALVMMGGEAGVGKTRLAEELAAEAQSGDFDVFVGHCYELEGTAHFLPFVEIFERALDRAESPRAFRAILGEEAPELSRLVPKLRRLCPDVPDPPGLPTNQHRPLLFDAVREVLARLARRRPLLLVLDDLHRADQGTLLLLEHLADRLNELPVLVIATYRNAEVDVHGPLRATVDALRRRQRARWLTLGPLPDDGVGRLVKVLVGQDAPDRLVRALAEETGGNPLHVEEVLRHLAQEGQLLDDAGRIRADLSLGGLDLPVMIGGAAGSRLGAGVRRLRRLPLPLQVLLLAAVHYGTARLGLSFATLSGIVAPVWPPSGVALAGLFVFGLRAWPAVALSQLLVLLDGDGPGWTMATVTLGTTLEATMGYALLRRVVFRPALERLVDVVALVVLAGALAGVVGAVFGAGSLTLGGAATGGFWQNWRVWWLADVLGVVVVAPVLLTALAPGPAGLANRIETAVLSAALAAAVVGLVALGTDPVGPYLVFPLLAWMAVRLSPAGAARVTLTVSLATVLLTSAGEGPFVDALPIRSLHHLDAFLGALALISLSLSALASERQRAREELLRANAELESRVAQRTEQLRARGEALARDRERLAEAQRLARVGSWEMHLASGRVVWSDEMYRIHQLEPADVDFQGDGAAAWLGARSHPDDTQRVEEAVDAALAAGTSFELDHRIVAAGGDVKWLHSRGRVVRDDAGVPVRLVGTAQEVTLTKAATGIDP